MSHADVDAEATSPDDGSLLLNSGAPAHVVQELLGHADLRTTRRAYAHLTAATLRREVDTHLPSIAVSRLEE